MIFVHTKTKKTRKAANNITHIQRMILAILYITIIHLCINTGCAQMGIFQIHYPIPHIDRM